MSVDDLLSRLDKVRRTGPGRWIACCPGHGDRSPSLSIRALDDGRILLHDFAGCHVSEIVAALGVELHDLFEPRPDAERRPRVRAPFSAGDALRCLSAEADLLAVCASDLAHGRPFNEATRQRLLIAASRINAARTVCHG